MDIIEGFLFIMEQEIWKDVPNYDGLYKCSNLGRVKSFMNRNGEKIRLLKQQKQITGYLTVRLYKDKKHKLMTVHAICAACFLGHKINGYNLVVDHIDGNKLNNNIDNLQITTQRNNVSKYYGMNRDKYSSKYIGVTFRNDSKKWSASIVINGTQEKLGSFKTEIEAHNAYQKKLKELTEL